jgi:hypothetical protein
MKDRTQWHCVCQRMGQADWDDGSGDRQLCRFGGSVKEDRKAELRTVVARRDAEELVYAVSRRSYERASCLA